MNNEDFYSADFTNSLPPALKNDPDMMALAQTISAQLQTTAAEVRRNIIYARIDELDEATLDVLAYDLHVDWYDYSYPIGVYIGGGKVIECSPAFKNCVQVTACLNIGAISGMNGRKWTKHGKLPYITYDTAGGAQDGAGSTTKPSGTTTTPATLAFAVGDVVRFTGNTHYTNAAAASGAACKPGTAKVTALAKGAKHPYHLIKQPGGGSTVYGWVNAADVQAVGSGTTAPKMRVGAKVKYSGPLYRDSNGGGQGKTVNGTYTVKYYYPGRKCGVHIDGLGWVPESGCTVIG